MTLLLDLWTIKIRQGNGRPFEASSDMYLVALDIILTAALNFPQNETMILKQIAKVRAATSPTAVQAWRRAVLVPDSTARPGTEVLRLSYRELGRGFPIAAPPALTLVVSTKDRVEEGRAAQQPHNQAEDQREHRPAGEGE